MTSRLRVGMGDSYGLRITVPSDTDFDPSLVTGGAFHVTKPKSDGTTEDIVWTGSIGQQSAQSVQLLYAFDADGSDLDYPGTWKVWIQWTVPGESPGPRSEVTSFKVLAANQ